MRDHSLCTEHAKEAFYQRLNYGWRGAGMIELIVDRWELIADREFFGCFFHRQIFIRHDFRREGYYAAASVCLQNIPPAWEVHTVSPPITVYEVIESSLLTPARFVPFSRRYHDEPIAANL